MKNDLMPWVKSLFKAKEKRASVAETEVSRLKRELRQAKDEAEYHRGMHRRLVDAFVDVRPGGEILRVCVNIDQSALSHMPMAMAHALSQAMHSVGMDLAKRGAKKYGWMALAPKQGAVPPCPITWESLDAMRRREDPDHPDAYEHMEKKYQFMRNNPWFEPVRQ